MPHLPAPAYPEHAALWERARVTAPAFVSPDWLTRIEALTRSRGNDWCTSVLGFPYPGVRAISVPQAQLLVLADAAGLNPPLPAPVVAARAAQERQRRLRDEQAARLAARDAARWADAVEGCAVTVQVRPNMAGRRYGTGLNAGPLRHAVPVVDVWSGVGARTRVHAAGRAVCETPARAKPLRLGDPVDAPATCDRCLGWLPKLRATR